MYDCIGRGIVGWLRRSFGFCETSVFFFWYGFFSLLLSFLFFVIRTWMCLAGVLSSEFWAFLFCLEFFFFFLLILW